LLFSKGNLISCVYEDVRGVTDTLVVNFFGWEEDPK